MDITSMIAGSEESIEYLQKNAKDIVSYKPEFLLSDLKKIFRMLGVSEYEVVVKVGDRAVREENKIDKVIDFLKVSGGGDVDIEVRVGKVKHEFKLAEDMLFDDGREMMGELFAKLRMKRRFEKLYEEMAVEEMGRFMELIPLMKETAINELKNSIKGKLQTDKQIQEKLNTINKQVMEDVFVALNTAVMSFVKLYKEDKLDLIPDEYEEGRNRITKNRKNLSKYVFWFVGDTLKKATKDEAPTLFLSVQATKLSFNYSIIIFSQLIKK